VLWPPAAVGKIEGEEDLLKWGEFRWLLCICVVSLVCFQKKKGGKVAACFFFFKKKRGGAAAEKEKQV
jgi:hypothetical protein